MNQGLSRASIGNSQQIVGMKDHIIIQDNNVVLTHSNEGETKPSNKKVENKVINYETFESSSEDEFSCGAFESAAHSFQNKVKN